MLFPAGTIFHADKINFPPLAAWLLTILIVLAGLKLVHLLVPGALMKLYVLIIQKHVLGG